MKNQASKDFLNFGLIIAIVVAVNIVGNYVYKTWDFTEEKRFTLTDATKSMLGEVEDVVYVKVLLDGKLPAGFKRLRQSTLEILKDFNSINKTIEFDFEDPTAGSIEKANARKEELSNIGIYPTNLRVAEGSETTEKLIYPYALINIGDRSMAVNLLEAQGIGISDELALNNSVSLLEYKFADAIQKLLSSRKPNILLTTGNGELRPEQTAAIENLLKSNFNTGRIDLDSIYNLGEDLDLLIVAGPSKPISQRSQFIIDQYVMNGGKVLWMIDYLTASLDSISKYENYVPEVYPLGIEDMFFKYGFRIQPNLILDLECTRIPQVIGSAGGKPQQEMFQFYYHPLIASNSEHPIVKNIDRVNMFFPSTIDTVRTKSRIKKEILLASSNYSRFQLTPVRLSFDILRFDADESKFDKGQQNVAVLLDGEFESLFKNRVSENMNGMLQDIGKSFKETSIKTKMIVISDSDFAKNLYSPKTNRISPIGFNQWEQFTFKGNQQFFYNAVEYLLDNRGLVEARGKDVKLRLLDKVKIQNERSYWQFLNLIFPIIFLVLIGIFYTIIRRRRFGNRNIKI